MGKKRLKKKICGSEETAIHNGESCRLFCKRDGKCSTDAGDNCEVCRCNEGLHLDLKTISSQKVVVEQFRDIRIIAQRYVRPMTTRGQHFLLKITDNLGIKKFLEKLSFLDKISLITIPPEGLCNLKMTLAEVLFDGKKCYYERSKRNGQVVQLPFAVDYCRSLTIFADFVTGIHDFQKLNETIKLKVTQRNYYDVALLRVMFLFYKNHGNILGQTKSVESEEATTPNHYSILLRLLLRFYNYHVFPLFERQAIKEEEINLLRLVALFHPFSDCTPICHDVIRCLHGKYLGLLMEYLNETNPDGDRLHRLQNLMSFLRNVKELSVIINKYYTNQLIHKMEGLTGPLSFDLHLQDYHV